MEAFVYIWTDRSNQKKYIGVHKGSPDDGYICSSKTVMAEYRSRPDDFFRIIVESGEWKEMAELEIKMLKEVDAAKNEDYYNLHNGNGAFILINHTPETIKKMSLLRTGKKRPESFRKKMSAIHKGKTVSKETRMKLSLANKGCVRSDEFKAKVAKASKGRLHSEEAKSKISSARKGMQFSEEHRKNLSIALKKARNKNA